MERMRSLWTRFLPAITTALKSETDLDVMVELLSAVSESIDVLGRNGVTAEELNEVSLLVQEQLNEYEKRRQEREAEEADEVGRQSGGKRKKMNCCFRMRILRTRAIR